MNETTDSIEALNECIAQFISIESDCRRVGLMIVASRLGQWISLMHLNIRRLQLINEKKAAKAASVETGVE